MTAVKSTKKKPAKPRPDWPLTASPNGHWVKKIKGRVYNFGRWDQPEDALARYVAERDYIAVHRCRPVDDGGLRLDHAVKLFLDRQKARLEGRIGKRISQRHFEDQKATCLVVLETFGLARSVQSLLPADFASSLYPKISTTQKGKARESSTVARNIANVKALFNWLAKENRIPNRLNFGGDFVPPVKEAAGDEVATVKAFTAGETWRLIEAASVNTRAMIWLALNTGTNNADCANVTRKAIDLEAKTLTWKRWKVRRKEHAKVRVIPLWPETVAALREAVAIRPDAKDPADANLFFLTYQGRQWGQWSLSQEVTKLKTCVSFSTQNNTQPMTASTRYRPTNTTKTIGKRFVAVGEPDSSAKIAESKVKDLTGDRVLKARRMREDFWEFQATHMFWLSTNHKPEISGTDEGIWRRVKLIPFSVNLKDVTTIDPQFAEKLKAEYSGILNWALEGWKRYQREGLIDCQAVIDATADYRESEDRVGQFIEETFQTNPQFIVGVSEAFDAYQASGGILTKTQFGSEMSKRFTKSKPAVGKYRNKFVYQGIGLAPTR